MRLERDKEVLVGAVETVEDVLNSPKVTPELRIFAEKNLLAHRRVSAGELRERIVFLRENVPAEMLSETYGDKDFFKRAYLQDLLRRRLSFLKALRERLSENEWLELLGDSERCRCFARAEYLGATIFRLSEKTFEDFASRKELPVDSEVDGDPLADEVKEMLKTSGIENIAVPFIQKVRLTRPVGDGIMHCSYHNLTGEVTANAKGDGVALLPGGIIHEAGHGIQYRMARDKRGKELFDKYIVATQLEETALSVYADSFKYSDGKASNAYVAESFSEEFRVYWLMPEELSADKRAIFDEICDRFLEGVDREKVRAGISKVLGNYYGKSVREAVMFGRKNPGRAARRAASRRNRAHDERERERRLEDQRAKND